MSTAVLTHRLELSSLAGTALKAAARFWFVVAVIGQFVFAFAVASFYGLTALRGDYHRWSKFITHGHVAGDTIGNFAVAMHVTSAAVIMLAGALQLAPGIRNRFPSFHRWNGRIYMLTAVTLSIAGLYMTWIRGSIGDLSQRIGGSLGAVAIWLCAGMALRYAMARDFKTHRRWALRLFLVASSAWFYRIVFFLAVAIFKGPFGFDPVTFTGPFPSIMSFAQYLFPLAILELYFRAQDRPSAPGRFATASLLIVLTLAMGAGLFVVTTSVWVPDVKAGFDSRKSIAETLSATIASSGIDQAEKRYHDLKATEPATYNFDEGELNSLGYQLIHQKKYAEAIRIFQLNIEAYPKSSNVYDSLAEGYMDDGEKARAIANYQKAIQLNPKNGNSISMLRKLSAP
jgi:tetratricopeptide (TPR) repeat protein